MSGKWKCQKLRNIKVAVTERKRNYLVSEPNYHKAILFSEKLLAREMRKTEILMNKHVCLDFQYYN